MSDQEFSDQPGGSNTPEETPPGEIPAAGDAPPPPPPPPPAEAAGDAGPDNKGLMLVLSYLWLLALIPLLVEKDSDVQWHAKNGIVWTIAEVLMHVVLWIVGTVVFFAGCFIGPLLMLGWLVVRIMAIMKALKGERMELPVLTDFVEKF